MRHVLIARLKGYPPKGVVERAGFEPATFCVLNFCAPPRFFALYTAPSPQTHCHCATFPCPARITLRPRRITCIKIHGSTLTHHVLLPFRRGHRRTPAEPRRRFFLGGLNAPVNPPAVDRNPSCIPRQLLSVGHIAMVYRVAALCSYATTCAH